jgi:hypothetical protein
MLMLEPNTIKMEDVKNNKRKIQHIKENLVRKIYNYEFFKEYLKNINTLTSENEATINRGDDILLFDYDFRRLKNFEDIDIIVIDECSTISRELYVYIESTLQWMQDNFNHSIKIIYLGDYYQLPPVGESKSVIFTISGQEKWATYKLSKVMRSKTPQMNYVNNCHLDFIKKKLKRKKLTPENIITPYKIIKKGHNIYITNYNAFIEKYVSIVDEDKIMITYSKNNSAKLNLSIQKILDFINKVSRPPDMEYSVAYKYVPIFINFLKKDRIMLTAPIHVPKYKIADDCYCINIDDVGEKLYSGDVFTVMQSKKIKIRTVMNTYDRFNYKNVPASFDGEMLEIRYLNAPDDTENKIIFHVNNLEVEKCRRILRSKLGWNEYTGTMQIFRKTFTIIKRGHCMTCYKSQGSEYRHVFVNLKSFWYSLLSDRRSCPRQLFSAFYTATTRASNFLYLYY